MNGSYNWKNLKPIGRRILVACEEEEETVTAGGLTLTHHFAPMNHFRILHAADDCKHAWCSNDLVLLRRLNRNAQQRFEVSRKERVYCVPEDMVLLLYQEEQLLPIGRHVLVRRRTTTEFDLDKKMIVGVRFAQSKDQTLECDLLAYGLLPLGETWGWDVPVGGTLSLKQWDKDAVELELHDGSLGLVAPARLFSHEVEHNTLLEYATP